MMSGSSVISRVVRFAPARHTGAPSFRKAMKSGGPKMSRPRRSGRPYLTSIQPPLT